MTEELTDVMAHSVILCLETLKKQEKQIKDLLEMIQFLQKMSNNQDQKIDLLKKMIENK